MDILIPVPRSVWTWTSVLLVLLVSGVWGQGITQFDDGDTIRNRSSSTTSLDAGPTSSSSIFTDKGTWSETDTTNAVTTNAVTTPTVTTPPAVTTPDTPTTTTVLRDVTATSQSIVLLGTEARNASENVSTSSTAGTTENPAESTTVSTTTVSGFTPSTTTTTSATSTQSWPTMILPLDNVTDNATTVDGAADQKDYKKVLLTFNGSCQEMTPTIVAQLDVLVGANGSGVDVPSCVGQVRVRLTVQDVGPYSELVGKARITLFGAPLLLSKAEVLEESDDGEDIFVPGVFGFPLTTREVVTYAIVGSIFGLAIICVSALLCCKCCCAGGRRKASRDIPRLAMRLEDYSLTRIPRPSTLFGSRNGVAETGREQQPSRQSFETSVIPLDDEYGSFRRGHQLRSFSGRRSRAAATQGMELQTGQVAGGSPALYGSNERLARDFGGQRHDKRGTDNHVFRF